MPAEYESDPPTFSSQIAIYLGLLSVLVHAAIIKNQQGLLEFNGYFHRNIQKD